MRALIFSGLASLFMLFGLRSATAEDVPLVADISSHLVAITTGFTGTDVLLFGAVDGQGDIAVVVRGPAKDVTVRRKDRVGPIWVNTEGVTFHDVPSYYRIASSRPLEEFAPQMLLSRYQIGLDNLRMADTNSKLAPEQEANFRKALVRLKSGEGLYEQGLGTVNFMSNRLFRTDLHFPANVPTGTYFVEVYLFRDNAVASAEIVPFTVSKIGTDADISDFAKNFSALYGLTAIVLAVGAGYAASAALGRV